MLFLLTPINKYFIEEGFGQKTHFSCQRGFLLKECFCLICIKRSAVFHLEMGLSTNGEKAKWLEHYSLTIGVSKQHDLKKIE